MPEAIGDIKKVRDDLASASGYLRHSPEFSMKFPRLVKVRILKFAGLRFWRWNRCLLEYRVGDDPPVTRWMRINDTLNIDINLSGWME